MDQLKQEIISRKICEDLASQAKNLVMGDGDVDAQIVFIGEAPGKNEDEQGLPFVGAAGKFLNEMLASVSLDREKVYITNIVKYRPPNNRDPWPAEKAEFWPYLLKQLEVIAPLLIVTLGRHSMEYFLPDARISAVHGHAQMATVRDNFGDFANDDSVENPSQETKSSQPQEFSWLVMPLFHPAAALYNGALRETLMDDFAKVPALLKKIQTRDLVLKIMTE